MSLIAGTQVLSIDELGVEELADNELKVGKFTVKKDDGVSMIQLAEMAKDIDCKKKCFYDHKTKKMKKIK